MKDLFPKLPTYNFAWRSMYVEPIPLSGERISLATIVKGEDSQFLVARTITGLKIRGLFGQKLGTHISDSLGVCLTNAEEFYAANPVDRNWEPQMEGFYLGETKQSLANSFEEALMIAASKSSSFSFALQVEKLAGETNKTSKVSPKAWRKGIFEAVTSKNRELADFFEKETPVRGAGVPIKFDFLSKPYAAQFESVADMSSIQSALVRSQSKLWQLDRLRDQHNLFGNETCELLLRKPRSTLPIETESINKFTDELRYEASRREISLFITESFEEAALRVIQQVT